MYSFCIYQYYPTYCDLVEHIEYPFMSSKSKTLGFYCFNKNIKPKFVYCSNEQKFNINNSSLSIYVNDVNVPEDMEPGSKIFLSKYKGEIFRIIFIN